MLSLIRSMMFAYIISNSFTTIGGNCPCIFNPRAIFRKKNNLDSFTYSLQDIKPQYF